MHYVLFAVLNVAVKRVVLYPRPGLGYYTMLPIFLKNVGFKVVARGSTVEGGAAHVNEEDVASCTDKYAMYERESMPSDATVKAATRFQSALLVCAKLSGNLQSSDRYFLAEKEDASTGGKGVLAGFVRLFAQFAKTGGVGWTEASVQHERDQFASVQCKRDQFAPPMNEGGGSVFCSTALQVSTLS
jgi:hypothetical protein